MSFKRASGLYESAVAIVYSITSETTPPVTIALLTATIVMRLFMTSQGMDWTNFCLQISPGMFEPLPYLGDRSAFLHCLPCLSWTRLLMQASALLLLGVHLERRIGSVKYLVILASCNYLTGWISLAMNLTRCYTSEGLCPALAGAAVVLHLENPLVFDRGLRVEPRWFVWVALFAFSLSSNSISQYFVGIIVGLIIGSLLYPRYLKSFIFVRFLLACLIYASVAIFPFSYNGDTLNNSTNEICIDGLSWLMVRILVISPLFALTGHHKWLGVIFAGVFVYSKVSGVLKIPGLGFLGLLTSSFLALRVN